jgi:hypothetical protein
MEQSEISSGLRLVLDLDETLISAVAKREDMEVPSFPVPPDVVTDWCLVWKRPGIDEFLKQCSQFAELILYTTGEEEKQKEILSKLGWDQIFTRCFFRYVHFTLVSFQTFLLSFPLHFSSISLTHLSLILQIGTHASSSLPDMSNL